MIETKREKEKKDIICMCVKKVFEINHTSKHFSSQQLTNNYFQQKKCVMAHVYKLTNNNVCVCEREREIEGEIV